MLQTVINVNYLTLLKVKLAVVCPFVCRLTAGTDCSQSDRPQVCMGDQTGGGGRGMCWGELMHDKRRR